MKPIPLMSKTRVGSERMRPLVIDDEAKESARRVREFAEQPANLYRPGITTTPGDMPGHSCLLNTYRCVFSVTEDLETKVRLRHLSISVPGAQYPHPAAAFTIAGLFGFTGWDGKTLDRLPRGWMGHVSESEHALVLGQEIGT